MRLFHRLFNALKKGNDFVIVKAGNNDKKEILRLMVEVFFKTDPSSVYSKVSENPHLSSVLKEISVNCLEEGMSFLAKNSENESSAVGLVLNGVRATTLSPNFMEPTLQKVKARCERTLLELWTFVSMMPPNSEKFFDGQNQVFEVRYLVVDPSRRNQGIASALVRRSIEEAKRTGYKFIRIDCTSHFTARIASAAGLNCIYELEYLNYKNFSGEKVFHSVVSPHTKIFVYAGKCF